MKEDSALARIGEHVREDQKDDARFERVARGEATTEELEALEQEAADDPALAARLAGSRPLDEAAALRIAARVRPADAKVAPLAPAKKGARPSRLRLAAITAPLAMAAALVLYLAAGPGGGVGALPGYSVSATGEQAMRGPAEATTRLSVGKGRDARFEIVARPDTAAPAKIVAYAFAMIDGEPSPLEAKTEVSADGAVRVTGTSRALEDAGEVRLVLGAPESIGKFDDALARAKRGSSDARVRVITVAIDRAR